MARQDSAAAKDKHETILAAAKQLFGHYGYRRTSIDDIAQEARIAKGTVYLYFKSKEEIFRALGQQLLDSVLTATEEACRGPAPIEQRLRRIIAAKFDYLFALVYDSAHVRELIDAKNQLSADIFAQADRRYLQLLSGVLAAAADRGELNLTRVGMVPEIMAELLIRSAAGNELYGPTLPTPAAMQKRLDGLVRVFVAAMDGVLVH